MTDDRTLPHSLDAERSVLGAIMVAPDAVYVAGAILEAEDFYRDAHQRIYRAMMALTEHGIAIDAVTLKNELAKRGDLDEVGGPAYVACLDDGVPRSTNIEYYARIVREKASLRSLVMAGKRMMALAYDASDDARLVLDEAEQTLMRIGQEAISGDLVFMDTLVPGAMALLEAVAHSGRAVTGVSTGWPDLDEITRGLHPGNLIVLGGRPGEGKSALALQMALHVAKTLPVAFFSMEMNREELTTRALAQLAHVSHHQMMQGRLSDEDQRGVGRARLTLEALPLAIDDTSSLTPYEIRSKAKKLQARKGLGLVVVDYLQLLKRPRHVNSREEAVAENTWALKVLAGELKVPVVTLSQLNRASVKEDRRPTLADLRESGAVEQHANVVLLLYKPQTDGPVNPRPDVELLIAKQRQGPSQTMVELTFFGEWMRFEARDRWHAAS